MNRYIYKSLFLCSLLSVFSNYEMQAQQAVGGVTGNNVVWLAADIGVTLSPTNTVTTWAEQSGAAVTGDFSTQGAAINKPSHQPPGILPNGINFNPYIVFNNTATPNSISAGNATTGTALLDATSNTLFQVIRLNTMTSTGVWLKWQWATSPYSGPRLGNEVNPGSNPGQIRFDFKSPSLYTTENVFNKHTISTQEVGSTNKTQRLNGTPNSTAAVTGTFSPGTTTGRLTLGAEPYGDDYPTKIDIAEVILFKRALTAAERNQVESYLAVKYGFTLPQVGANATNYTASNGTITWNNAANAPYINNITGVGLDQTTLLHQKQSLSINNRAMVTIYNGNVPGVFPSVNADNTNTFATDRSFVLFGDNLGDTLINICSNNGRFRRMGRIWKVQTTGSPGAVTLALKKANVPSQITALIVANDPGFNTGLVAIPIQDNGTELYASHTFANNQYYTFGTMPIQLNGTVGPVVCQGNNGSVTLNPTGGVPPISYSWNSTPPQSTQDLSGVAPGTYTVTVTHGGCSFTESFAISGTATPVFLKVIDTANTLCTTNNGMIEVIGTGGTPTYTYSIDNGTYSSIKKFRNLAPGSHIIRIKDQNGCEHDTTVVLDKYTYKLEISGEGEDAYCDANGYGGVVRITASGGTQPYSYFWSNYSSGAGAEMLTLPKGTYNVIVTDRYGCSGDTSITIGEKPCCEMGLPNTFTPNNDGLNDKFIPIVNVPISKYDLTIFNRWGQKVFGTVKYDEGWDGTLQKNGKPLENGIYYYRLVYTCDKGLKEEIKYGDITLIR